MASGRELFGVVPARKCVARWPSAHQGETRGTTPVCGGVRQPLETTSTSPRLPGRTTLQGPARRRRWKRMCLAHEATQIPKRCMGRRPLACGRALRNATPSASDEVEVLDKSPLCFRTEHPALSERNRVKSRDDAPEAVARGSCPATDTVQNSRSAPPKCGFWDG